MSRGACAFRTLAGNEHQRAHALPKAGREPLAQAGRLFGTGQAAASTGRRAMNDLAQRFVKEPGAESAQQYARRVRRLALWYVSLSLLSLLGLALLVWKAQDYVTLTQRSNVETLTLAFLFVFFAYLLVLSAPGTWGVVRLLRHTLGGSWEDRQRRKMQALGPPKGRPVAADTNLILEREDRPGEAFELAVADAAGRMGTIRVDGARLSDEPAHKDGSSDVLAYFAAQATQVIRARGLDTDVDIVAWKALDDEEAEQYHGLVQFARNLERQLGRGELWPKATLTAADCEELENRLGAICPALRNEGFLPQWDYSAEHKVPVIPEPLGLLSLSRSEKRVDPVASMGCAVWVVAFVVAVLGLFVVSPPWVPGK
jgi:hypothetical protein